MQQQGSKGIEGEVIGDLPEDASIINLPHEASVANNKMNDEEKEEGGDGQ